MSATGTPTPNIGLRIPLGTDPASVDDINYNSNLIDTKLGAVGNDSVQDQIDELNGKITIKESAVTTGFMLYRSAGSVFGACLGGSVYSCDSANGVVKYNGTVITVPSGYRPLYGVDIRDTLGNFRIFISPDGTISSAEAFSSRAIRFSTTWLTNDAYPT